MAPGQSSVWESCFSRGLLSCLGVFSSTRQGPPQRPVLVSPHTRATWQSVRGGFGQLLSCQKKELRSHFHEGTTVINCEMCSLLPQGAFPWDDKGSHSLAVLGAGVAMGFSYLYFRNPGNDWKHFVQYYLAGGL